MTSYKSKDVEYMQKLKKAILRGMRGQMPEEKTYTWEYVRKQVVLDDLHAYAMNTLGKLVHFPNEHYNAKIMVIFLHPPVASELEVLHRMMAAYRVKKEDVYITYMGKAEISEASEGVVLESILQSEISVIKPELILSFGLNIHPDAHTVTNFKEAKLLVSYDMNYIMKDHALPVEERKQALWNDVKQLMQYYKL